MVGLLRSSGRRDKYCVVVDGVAGGARLARDFRARGYRCVHVRSYPHSDDRLLIDFDADSFDDLIDYDGDFDRLLQRLSQDYDPELVAVGCEEGVELGDALNEALGRPHHGNGLRRRLRHKHLMNRAVREAGLPAPLSLVADNPEAAARAALEIGSWPLVVKPKDSSGGNGVRICNDIADVREAAEALFGTPNIMNEVNSEIAIQSFIPGHEKFTVDTLSEDGEHFVVSVWQDQTVVTHGGSPVLRGARLLPGDGVDAAAASQAARRCLDAIGLRHGPAMLEFIRHENLFYFIEVNARLCGLPSWHEEFSRALDFTHDRAYVAWLCDGLNLRTALKQPYHLRRHVWWAAALSIRTAVVQSLQGLGRVTSLPSFVNILSCAEVGELVTPTEDMFSFPLTVLLSHEDEKQIVADFSYFADLRDEEIFSFSP